MKGLGSKGQFSFFYGSLQRYKYGMRLNTQRISGHMLQSALEYTKSSAPRCLQAIYHLKQDKKQQNLKRRKSREIKMRSGTESLFLCFLLPLSFISTCSPYLPAGLPQFPIRAQICKPRWGIHHGLTWSLPSSAWRFKLVLWVFIPCCFHPMFSSNPCLLLY